MATEKRLIIASDLWSDIMMLPHNGDMISSEEVEQAIMDAPNVDAVEVVHGRWVDRYGGKYANPLYECSECKKKAPYKFEDDSLHIGLWLQDLTDYCPNCGAKMDGDGNG